MSGTTFTYPLAKRIVSSTKWTEEQRGIIPEIETPIIVNGNQDLLVRTSSTLPVGYTGAMAVQGEIVEQNQNGTYLPQMPIWIRDQNGGMLNSNTIYQARVGGTWTQNVTINGILAPTTLGLYLVQAASTGSGLTIGSSISGRIQVDYNAPNNSNRPVLMSATLPDGSMQSFTILNVGPDWRFGESTISAHGMAIVTDPLKRTAQLSTVFPFLVQGECEKDYLGNIIWRGAYRNPYPVFDPLKLTTKLGGYFYGIMIAPCSFTSPPTLWLYMATVYGWQTGQYSHPWASSISGIGSGIGSGISGV